tara:strand:+ start:71148 stop:71708 length:561 start_codon:yes stop_codon:yes gene_type:complete
MATRKFHITIALLAAGVLVTGAGEQGKESHPAMGASLSTPIAAVATTISVPPQSAAAFRPNPALGQKEAYVIRRSSDGLFYVDAMIGKDAIRFLVDTGANVTVLTRADAERLGLSSPNASRTTMQTAGGPTSMQWTKIPLINIANRPVDNVNAAIIDKGIQVSLLGQNVLSRMEGLTFTGDQLRFH